MRACAYLQTMRIMKYILYICLNMCIYIYVKIHKYVRIHIYIYVCMLMYVCMYVCMYIYMYVSIYTCVFNALCIYIYTILQSVWALTASGRSNSGHPSAFNVMCKSHSITPQHHIVVIWRQAKLLPKGWHLDMFHHITWPKRLLEDKALLGPFWGLC